MNRRNVMPRSANHSFLPIMAAMLLVPGKSILRKTPKNSEMSISLMIQLLHTLGVKVKWTSTGNIHIDATNIDSPVSDYSIVRKFRVSICILGPLLARCGRARVAIPGGYFIGDRPIDIHLRGLAELGAKFRFKNGYIVAKVPSSGLLGKDIFLGGTYSSVLGTANTMMAATLAKGKTTIEMAVCKPEISNLARCLNKMGARISGIGSPRLTIYGVKGVHPVEYAV